MRYEGIYLSYRLSLRVNDDRVITIDDKSMISLSLALEREFDDYPYDD